MDCSDLSRHLVASLSRRALEVGTSEHVGGPSGSYEAIYPRFLPLDGAWLNQNRSLMQILKSTVHKGLDSPKQRRSEFGIPNGASHFGAKPLPASR